jgi:flavin-dependent dehydrogenase
MTEPDFDAVVVGASVAGCTAARLFAQRGARVALVERRPDVEAYKTVCTHYIQPSATPTIEKLGLAALIEEHGAVRNSIDLWTPYGGWIRHRGGAPYGYNVTRQILDPLLRRLTAATPGVELLSGYTATELLALLKRRAVSAVEVTKAFLDRIERLDPQINSYITVTADASFGRPRCCR